MLLTSNIRLIPLGPAAMRFLLTAAASAASKPRGASAVTQATKGTGGTSTAASAAAAAATTLRAGGGGVSIPRHDLQQHQHKHPRLQKSWGQKCSPNCGCVVRYETVVDEATGRIVDATYHAKSVLLSASSKDEGNLVPQLTQTPAARPILTECRCPTVHHLSSRITSYLKNRSIQHIYNTVEFSGVRSSPSFRRAVLAENGLGRGSTGCYDLVEEAFVACVKGYMPKPRMGLYDNDNNDDSTYQSDKRRRMLVDKAAADDATTAANQSTRGLNLNPTRYADAARRAGKAFPPSHRNGTMNVNISNAPVDSMPSYSLLGSDHREKNEESANMYRPRPTVGAATQAAIAEGGDVMPAFHISEEQHLNELEKRYDDELDGLREVQWYLTTNGRASRRKVGTDDERALLSDWQAYVDGEMNKKENKEEAS